MDEREEKRKLTGEKDAAHFVKKRKKIKKMIDLTGDDLDVSVKVNGRNKRYSDSYLQEINVEPILTYCNDAYMDGDLRKPDYTETSVEDTNKKSEQNMGGINGYSPMHRIVNGKQNHQLEEILKQGYVRKKGKWQPDEIELLERNMEEFLSYHNVKDFEGLICIRTQEDRKFRKRTKFILHMCRGIQRTGADVTARIQVQFTPFLKKGHYSREEVAQLKQLHMIYGSNWKTIGQIMNRSYLNLLNIHHFNSKEWNSGGWSLEEHKLLISSVLEYLETGTEVSWKKVSGKVKTRPGQICRIEWYKRFRQISDRHSFERWLSKTSQSTDYTEKETVEISNNEVYKLITFISDANIDDEYFIDWIDLANSFGNKVSPSWLKWKFKVICKEVPGGHRLEFVDLIDHLLDIYHEKQVNDKSTGEGPPTEYIDQD